jgi:hypothetical protein
MVRILASILAIALFFLASGPVFCRQLVIFKSQDYVSRSYEVQRFEDRINLQAGQLTVPLTMTIMNGSAEAPSYKWFRIMVNGQLIASEKDMQGKDTASKDVSGLLQGSDVQVLVEAGGVPGANLWWYMSAPQMELSYAEPAQAQVGQELTLHGSNFLSDPSLMSVTFNGKSARVVSANSNALLVQVPSSVQAGTNQIIVRSPLRTSNPITTVIGTHPVPEILGIDCWMAPPGGTIHISGRNFSNNSVSNKVLFGDVPGQVESASATNLTVIVPNWSYGPSQLNIPVTVEVEGYRSANTYQFDIGPSYHGAIPQFQQD